MCACVRARMCSVCSRALSFGGLGTFAASLLALLADDCLVHDDEDVVCVSYVCRGSYVCRRAFQSSSRGGTLFCTVDDAQVHLAGLTSSS